MRNGCLCSLLVVLGLGQGALAQMPYPPSYPLPPMPPPWLAPAGMTAPSPLLIGGALTADGPIDLPSLKQKPRPLSSVWQQTPQPMRPHHPRQTRTKAAAQRSASGITPASLATLAAGADVPVVSEPAAPPAAVEPVAPLKGDIYPPICEVEPACPPAPLSAACPLPRNTPCGYWTYGSAEYLYWWTPVQNSPPLAVLGPLAAPQQVVGGPSMLDNHGHSGGRFTLGAWLNAYQTVGAEVTFWFLGQTSPSQQLATPRTGPALSRPYIDAATGAAAGLPLTQPGIQNGSLKISQTNWLWNIEANLRKEMFRTAWGHLDVLGGFRYLSLNESLELNSTTAFITAPIVLSDANVFSRDFFGTENSFYGGQLGLQGNVTYGPFNVDGWGKIALGGNQETVVIHGATVIQAPPTPIGNVTTASGLLAQSTNSGIFNRNQFTVIPEAGVKVSVQVTSYLRLTGGYTFVYINNVVRPGSQIDPVVNPTQVPQLQLGPPTGPARPQFTFQSDSYWIHGPSVGMEWRF